ncbi:hypothetical protein HAX54_029548, partial [Datura stramonium]|nr:hypothetical protein [Datura stramonium]
VPSSALGSLRDTCARHVSLRSISAAVCPTQVQISIYKMKMVTQMPMPSPSESALYLRAAGKVQ